MAKIKFAVNCFTNHRCYWRPENIF